MSELLSKEELRALERLEKEFEGKPGAHWATSRACCPVCGQKYVQGTCPCAPGPRGSYYNPVS